MPKSRVGPKFHIYLLNKNVHLLRSAIKNYVPVHGVSILTAPLSSEGSGESEHTCSYSPEPSLCAFTKYEQQHEIFNNVVCATSKASDQPAHKRSLIRPFASRLNML